MANLIKNDISLLPSSKFSAYLVLLIKMKKAYASLLHSVLLIFIISPFKRELYERYDSNSAL